MTFLSSHPNRIAATKINKAKPILFIPFSISEIHLIRISPISRIMSIKDIEEDRLLDQEEAPRQSAGEEHVPIPWDVRPRSEGVELAPFSRIVQHAMCFRIVHAMCSRKDYVSI